MRRPQTEPHAAGSKQVRLLVSPSSHALTAPLMLLSVPGRASGINPASTGCRAVCVRSHNQGQSLQCSCLVRKQNVALRAFSHTQQRGNGQALGRGRVGLPDDDIGNLPLANCDALFQNARISPSSSTPPSILVFESHHLMIT